MVLAAAALRGKESGGVAENAVCRPAIRSDSGAALTRALGDLQGDRAEHVDDEQVARRAASVGSGPASADNCSSRPLSAMACGPSIGPPIMRLTAPG